MSLTTLKKSHLIGTALRDSQAIDLEFCKTLLIGMAARIGFPYQDWPNDSTAYEIVLDGFIAKLKQAHPEMFGSPSNLFENKYLVFTGDDNYPSGGWSDHVATCDSADEAVAHLIASRKDWYQVVRNGEVIKSGKTS